MSAQEKIYYLLQPPPPAGPPLPATATPTSWACTVRVWKKYLKKCLKCCWVLRWKGEALDIDAATAATAKPGSVDAIESLNPHGHAHAWSFQTVAWAHAISAA